MDQVLSWDKEKFRPDSMDQVLSWDREKFHPDSMDQVLSWDREKTYVASPVWIIESLVFTPLRSHLGDKTLALGNPFVT